MPEITPVVVFKTRPVGNAGLTLKPVAVPVIEGTISVITLSFVKVVGKLYDKFAGGGKIWIPVLVTDTAGLP